MISVKRTRICILPVLLFLTVFGFLSTSSHAAITDAVCSEGTGIPPFLSAGADPNLLLILDNSGSMLDTAYLDPYDDNDADTDPENRCFDDTFLSSRTDATTYVTDLEKEYAGYYEKDTWYLWVDATSTNSTRWAEDTYNDGAMVFDHGVFYTADCSGDATCTSTVGATSIDKDLAINWIPIGGAGLDPYQNGKVYAADSYVKYESQLYYAATGGTANGAKPSADTGISWEAVDHFWLPSNAYVAGDIVTYKGMIYRAVKAFTSSSTGLFDDRDGSDGTGAFRWERLDEGYFEEYDGDRTPCNSSGDASHLTHLHTPTFSTAYTANGISIDTLEITLMDKDGNKVQQIVDDYEAVGAPEPPTDVYCFAAKGNFINWASASKFDIQKKILTGGKYSAGYEVQDATGAVDNSVTTDTADDRLIAESRGCSGSGFIKQITLDTTDNVKLTLRSRGPEDGEWLDTTDDTNRIEILGVTVGGFDNGTCQDVVADIATSGLNGKQTAINNCLSGGDNTARSALNHSLQYCWQRRENRTRNIKTLIDDCEGIYGSLEPSAISSFENSYMCYGIFNSSVVHDDREGYIGRCWQPAISVGGATCDRVTVTADCGPSYPCEYGSGDDNLFRNTAAGFNDVCTNVRNNNATVCNNNNSWEEQYAWSDGSGVCDPTAPIGGGTPAGYTRELDGDPLTTVYPEIIISAADLALKSNSVSLDDDSWYCVFRAMEDFCDSLNVPEVIDPTDAASNTTDYWNMPALLIDSGAIIQLNADRPLLTMKGYLKHTLPSMQESDVVQRPDGPRGVLFDVAEELRLGVMAFNDNGSSTECNDAVVDNIQQFCPDEDQDGSRLLAPIAVGMYMNDVNNTPGDPSDDEEVWGHYNSIVTSVNGIRATSWTPLAEAYYNALGYYGQDQTRRINITDFSLGQDVVSWVSGTSYINGQIVEYFGNYWQRVVDDDINSWVKVTGLVDTDPDPDPVQYWCQSNNILIITEGASTADSNAAVAAFASSALGKDTDTDTGTCTADKLEGSTYLDDLSYFAQHGHPDDIYTDACLGTCDTNTPDKADYKQSITTHIITTGSLRDDGTNDECNPYNIITEAAANGAAAGSASTFYSGEKPEDLATNLKKALSDIMSRASAGSAASVISSSRSGQGAAYQAVFWPKVPRSVGQDNLTWVGDVHALFVDARSALWDDNNAWDGTSTSTDNIAGSLWSEDKNGNGQIDGTEDSSSNNNGCLDGDRRVFFYYNESTSTTNICFNDSVLTSNPPVCDTALTDYCGTYTEPIDIKDFTDYLWSANEQLGSLDVLPGNLIDNPGYSSVLQNRSLVNGKWDTSGTAIDRRRYVFTWNDLDNDGIVDSDEMLEFEDSTDWAALDTTHHNILDDFNMSSVTEMNAFVNWYRGVDSLYETDGGDGEFDAVDDINGNGKQDYVYRCRRYPNCVDPSSSDALLYANQEWRLGDVIHSTPTLVGQPAEGYHTIYRDPSYAWFVKKYRFRRNVIIFGANDGMMHALNGGFFDENNTKFWRNQTYDAGTQEYGYDDSSNIELGDEMWAYIPYNLQPHLKCLSDDNYDHKYFVDQKPRVMDVRIFEPEVACLGSNTAPDCIHPEGWGTILIGSMRFGGAPVEVGGTDNRQFISSYFILDITDPERPPTLLGEMTMTNDDSDGDTNLDFADLGFTTPVPTGVVIRDSGGDSNWYLVFGSGPETLKGENSKQGKVAVLPLNWLSSMNAGDPKRPFRIPNKAPASTTSYGGVSFPYGGIYLIPDDGDNAAISDIDTSFTGDLISADFNIESQADAEKGSFYKTDVVYFGTVDGSGFSTYAGEPDNTFWNGDGRLFRLVTQVLDGADKETTTTPADWYLKKMMDAQAAITAAPAIGWDNDNFWIYFGTGRFFAKEDKTDREENYFYGVKEPLSNVAGDCGIPILTWDEVDWLFGSPAAPIATNSSAVKGSRGLFRADWVQVVDIATSMIQGKAYAFCTQSAIASGECVLAGLGLTALAAPAGDATTNVYYTFDDIVKYVSGEHCYQADDTTIGIDGWYRVFREERERNVGQSTLLGGLNTFTTYTPSDQICTAEGVSDLYGVHFQTGTAWYENVFGVNALDGDRDVVLDKYSLGQGLATTPSLHVGSSSDSDATAFIQTSTGEIVEVKQDKLPIKPLQPGKTNWNDICQ